MNGFDDIPENDHESYLCPECQGSVTKNAQGTWECDTCDWSAE